MLHWSPGFTSHHFPQYVFEPGAELVGTGAGDVGVICAKSEVSGGTKGVPGAEMHS